MPNLFLTAFICALLQFVNTSEAKAEGEKIAEVQVKGARRIAESTILSVTRLKSGDFLSNEKADTDLRAIFKLGHFQDIRISTAKTSKGTVLIYTVLEKPVISSITFVGNKELKTDRLEKDGLEIKTKSVFSAKDLDRTVAKLKKVYGDKGYYLAEVKPVVEKISPTELAITFNIVEGKKILIENITFEGNKNFSDSTFKGNRLLLKPGVMETKEAWFMSWLTDAGTYMEEVLNNDALLIADYYMNNGYINVKVGEPSVKLNKDRDGLDVHISITEGEQYRLGDIDIKGDLLEPVSELKKKLKGEPGAVFSRATMRADITTLTDVYGDKGYAFANIVPLTKPDHEKKKVDVTFDIEKGDLVYIERISVSGNPKTRDKVIRREMRVTEGELYSSTGLKDSKKNLMNTNYFEQANIGTSKGSTSNKLNVKVDVKEKPTGSFSIGGGYSSLDGIIGQGSVSQGNFLGLGLKANLSASIGGKSQTYSVGVLDPYFLDSKWSLGADIYRSERDYTDYSRRLTGGNIKTGYPISDTLSTFFLYKYEIKELYNPIAAYQADHDAEPDSYQLGSSTTSMVMGNISRNTTDYRIDPSTGMINNLTIEYAGLGGNNKFARFTTDHTWFYPLYKKLIFSTKLGLGYIQDVEGAKVPIDEKFYLGGISALRGFGSRTVSPTKTSTATGGRVYLGGNKELYGNAELTFPLLPEAGIKMVTFFDYGNAYGEGQKMLSSVFMSYGAGIRWASPLGPLRLEYGFPVNPRSGIDNSSGKLEFAIGSLF